MTIPMDDTLLFRVKALRKPGVSVVYRNLAMPSVTGSGVLLSPPADEEDGVYLLWWEGDLQDTAFNVTRDAFNRFVGFELGAMPGHGVRVSVPWLLEIDFSKSEGRATALEWASREEPTTLTIESDPEEIRKLCWSLVEVEADSADPTDSEGRR